MLINFSLALKSSGLASMSSKESSDQGPRSTRTLYFNALGQVYIFALLPAHNKCFNFNFLISSLLDFVNLAPTGQKLWK